MKYFKLLLISTLIATTNLTWGQNVTLTPDEVAKLKELAEYNSRWNIFLNIWAILGPILGVVITYFGLKNRIEKWAEQEVTKQHSEKIGADWNVLKSVIEERKSLLEKRAKLKIVIVSNRGKQKEIHDLIYDSGFNEPQWMTLEEFQNGFKVNQFNAILIDDEEGTLGEEKILSHILEPYKQGFKFVWLLKNDVSTETFRKYTGVSKFVKQRGYLIENLDNLV